jgi:hypothetical protein
MLHQLRERAEVATALFLPQCMSPFLARTGQSVISAVESAAGGRSGKYLLRQSISGFDPRRTSSVRERWLAILSRWNPAAAREGRRTHRAAHRQLSLTKWSDQPGTGARARTSASRVGHRGRRRVDACARRSTRRGGSCRRLLRRGGSGRRLLGCRSARGSRRARDSGDSRAWLTAAVHHAHFPRVALADCGAHLRIPYADAIDQLTSQAASLANCNDQILRLLERDIRHALC